MRHGTKNMAMHSPPVANDEERWAAVLRRDPQADFYYSVLTTGVYCRPSCPSRTALRQNVAFHDTCADAEQAGFRPCRRCLPNEASLEERRAAAVGEACRLIENSDSEPNLDQLAESCGMSRFHFHRVFKNITGVTPKAYMAGHRMQRLQTELPRSNTVTAAIYDAGFNSDGRFYAKSSEMLGMTPTSYRNGGKGVSIRFAVGECTLGSILVAATNKGICAILLGDDPELLVQDVQNRFPKADFIGGDTHFEQLVAKVVGFVEAPRIGLDLPLDLQGTAFQQRVWQALRNIPAGVTVSYSELAQRLGMPNATRAIAQACAANHIAVAIPCHRVIRNDGGLSGYRWGIERKRALLENEAQQ